MVTQTQRSKESVLQHYILENSILWNIRGAGGCVERETQKTTTFAFVFV